MSPTAACENPGQIKECPPALRCLWVREQTLENSDPACFHSNWASGPSSRWPMTTPTLGGRALQHSGHIQCQALQSVGQEWPFHLAVFLSFLGPGVGSLGRCKKKQRQAVHYNSGPRPASSITRHRIRLISGTMNLQQCSQRMLSDPHPEPQSTAQSIQAATKVKRLDQVCSVRLPCLSHTSLPPKFLSKTTHYFTLQSFFKLMTGK